MDFTNSKMIYTLFCVWSVTFIYFRCNIWSFELSGTMKWCQSGAVPKPKCRCRCSTHGRIDPRVAKMRGQMIWGQDQHHCVVATLVVSCRYATCLLISGCRQAPGIHVMQIRLWSSCQCMSGALVFLQCLISIFPL